MSGNLIAVREISVNCQGKNFVLECERFIILLSAADLHCCGWVFKLCIHSLWNLSAFIVWPLQIKLYYMHHAMIWVTFNIRRRAATVREMSGNFTVSWEWLPYILIAANVWSLVTFSQMWWFVWNSHTVCCCIYCYLWISDETACMLFRVPDCMTLGLWFTCQCVCAPCRLGHVSHLENSADAVCGIFTRCTPLYGFLTPNQKCRWTEGLLD